MVSYNVQHIIIIKHIMLKTLLNLLTGVQCTCMAGLKANVLDTPSNLYLSNFSALWTVCWLHFSFKEIYIKVLCCKICK